MQNKLLEGRVTSEERPVSAKSKVYEGKPFPLFYAERSLDCEGSSEKETGTYSPKQNITQKDD